MADTEQVGSDLQVSDSGSVQGNQEPADKGFTRDSLGNQYLEPRQGTSTAAGTAVQATATPATAAVPGTGVEPTAPAQTDPALVAARAEAARATEIAQAFYQREQQRDEQNFRARLATLTQPEQRLAMREREVEQAAQQLQGMLARHQAQQASSEPFMKGIAVDLLVSQHAEKTGVAPETLKAMLSKQSSPEAMEAVCEALAGLAKDATLQVRAKAGTDAAVTAGSGTSRPATAQSWKTQSLRQELSAAFA